MNQPTQPQSDRVLPIRPQVVDRDSKPRSGLIIIRLSKDAATSTGDADLELLSTYAERHDLKRLRFVLDQYSIDARRLITAISPDKLSEIEQAAARSEYRPLRSLTSYWRIDARGMARATLDALLSELSDVHGVDRAWEQSVATPPLVTPGDDPYNAGQTYQDPAPDGINARGMWTLSDGEGAGVRVIDVEGGWRSTHEDLVGKTPTMIHGSENPGWVAHGTAVLGEIVATDNSAGVVGTAPAITSVRMASIWDPALSDNTADAIVAALLAASLGDIVLIEVQLAFLPVESADECLDAIRLAVAHGITVVEPAGNGSADLDAWVGPGGRRLDCTSPSFVDSGAIMVGACVSTLPHDRWSDSNFGSRVDCYAHGDNVTTTGYGDLDDGGGDPDRAYTDTFHGTSSAAPIIVGAAALVQSRYRALGHTTLSPTQMRAILSNPATGTAQGTGVVGAIGVMPNLSAIAPSLGLVPDVYMRDAIGDDGAVPWTGAISVSPDIIVRPASVANPQLTYGEGSGLENDDSLGGNVEAGQDNVIYVRVRNRGGSPAASVTAAVYWSPVATLVTPSLWTRIGSVTIPNVPIGDQLTVSPALVWPQASIPSSGHHCFVATLGNAQDPEPPAPGSLPNWSDFYAYIQNHNNVTWRNFNVVNDLPDPPSATAFDFLMTGAEGEAVAFEFVIERSLPRDARLDLEGPAVVLGQLRRTNEWAQNRIDQTHLRRISLPTLPRVALGKITLREKARWPLRLVVRPGKESIAWGHGFSIRQLYRGREVGRVRWLFAPKERNNR